MTQLRHIKTSDKTQQISTILHRRKMAVTGLFLLCFSASAVAIQNIKPVYEATAAISFENQDIAYVNTQKHVIKSLDIGRKVVEGLNLYEDPQFAKIKLPDDPKFRALNLAGTTSNIDATDMVSKEHAALIHNVLAPLTISHPENSQVLTLSYSDTDPEKAARILSSVIRHYSAEQQDKAVYTPQGIPQNNSALYSSVKNSLDQVNATLVNLQTHQSPAFATEKYIQDEASADSVKKLTQLEELRAPFVMENGALFVNMRAPAVTGSSTIQSLQKDKRETLKNLTATLGKYGKKHPKIKALKADISALDIQIYDEANAIMLQIDRDYAKAKTAAQSHKEERYAAQSNEMLRHAETFNQIETSLSGLEDVMHDINYAPSLVSVTTSSASLMPKIISPATAPLAPVFPNKVVFTAFALLISGLLSALIVVLIERGRKTYISGRQLETDLDMPCYALIPDLKTAKGKQPADYIMENPGSDLAEAVRALRTSIKLGVKEKRHSGRVIALTSSYTNEGKTTLSTMLARSAARTGERVLLIDADLRTPSVHKTTGRKHPNSLVDFLSGKSKPEEIIDTKDPSGMHVIYSHAVPYSALDFLSSRKMDKLIMAVRSEYDLVIIDTPASMALSDARAIQKNCDLLLYLVAWHKTRHEVVHNGISQFTKSENQEIATVLSKVDVKKHVQYGFGSVVSDYGTYQPA